MSGLSPDDRWAASTWEGARDNTRSLGRSLTLTEKVDWLEAAQRLVLGLRRRPEHAAHPPQTADLSPRKDSGQD